MRDRLGLAYQVLTKTPLSWVSKFLTSEITVEIFLFPRAMGFRFVIVDEQRDENITWRNEQQYLEFLCENYHRQFSYYSEIHLIRIQYYENYKYVDFKYESLNETYWKIINVNIHRI